MQLMIVSFVVLVDLIGFGLIIPLSPYFAVELGASSFQVGLLLSIYSIMQFFFSPIWGKLSDKFGRRPIILISLLGGGISHLMFALSNELFFLFLARVSAGFFGSTISVASAYIADQSDEESRSKNMGLIGAAFGLGFVFGPMLAGFLSFWGESLGLEGVSLIGFPALGASILAFCNFVFAFFKLKESLPKKGSFSREIFFDFKSLVGKILLLSLIFVVAMGQMESTLALLVKDIFGFKVTTTSFAFCYVGVILAFSNGVLFRKLVPKFGEGLLLGSGLVLCCISMFLIANSYTLFFLTISVTLLALGSGCVTPSLLGILSLSYPKEKQGFIMGVYQSYASIGRVLGSISGGYFYGSLGVRSPYNISAVYMLIGFFVLMYVYKKIPKVR